jgi:hypothetical protein
VKDLATRLGRAMGRFEAIEGREKLRKRERELEEMEKRVGQIEIMVERMLEDDLQGMQEVETSESETKAKIIREVDGIKEGLGELKSADIARIHKGLADCRLELIKYNNS